jgi:siroheme synthase-like protein
MADDSPTTPRRPVLVDRRFVPDTYSEAALDGALPEGDVIVPLARLASISGRKVGVLLLPTDDVRALAGQLDKVALVALRFGKATEGRPYSQARLLRSELGWQGPIRATGHVLRDMAFFMHRCGMDQLVMRDEHEALVDDAHGSAIDALDSFSVRYQGSSIDEATPRALPRTYPLFLKLDGRRALVIAPAQGDRTMADKKADELRLAGAVVRVTSNYREGDARGHALVIAASGERATDRRVAADAKQCGVLVNAVDDVDACDFYTGGLVRRGPVIVAVGTSGASPTLARKVRKLIDDALPQALGPLAEALGQARPRILAKYPGFTDRAKLLEAFVERALARLTAGTTRESVARAIDEELLR